MDCCANKLGSYPHNEPINTKIVATQNGEHTFQLSFAGTKMIKKAMFLIGEELTIPKPFNESYVYQLQIIQPDGQLISQNECMFFKFDTYISIEGECGTYCEPIEAYS